MQMPDRRMFFQINWGLVFFTIVLFAIGMGNLYSASGSRIEGGFVLFSFYQKQLAWGGIGLLVMVMCMLIDYRRIERLAVPCYIIILLLVMLVPVVGKTVYGAKRWIDLGVMN
ncbi:MAG: FtsW/RodA/SpoVE family cell cycle protein, partial [Mailhella sp.]